MLTSLREDCIFFSSPNSEDEDFYDVQVFESDSSVSDVDGGNGVRPNRNWPQEHRTENQTVSEFAPEHLKRLKLQYLRDLQTITSSRIFSRINLQRASLAEERKRKAASFREMCQLRDSELRRSLKRSTLSGLIKILV